MEVCAKAVKVYLRDEEFLLQISKRIRELREAKGITQTELATLCDEIATDGQSKNKDYTQISRMERGLVNFTVSYLNVLAKVFEIPVRELLP